MPKITASNQILPKLRQALRTRLASLPTGSQRIPAADSNDELCESALYRLSVPLRRKLLSHKLASEDCSELLTVLLVVAGRATWNDLRYLDAFNVCHESWDSGYLPGARQEFLALYRAVLERALADHS